MAAFDFLEWERRLQEAIKIDAPCTSVQPVATPVTETKSPVPHGEYPMSEEQLATLREPMGPRPPN